MHPSQYMLALIEMVLRKPVRNLEQFMNITSQKIIQCCQEQNPKAPAYNKYYTQINQIYSTRNLESPVMTPCDIPIYLYSQDLQHIMQYAMNLAFINDSQIP